MKISTILTCTFFLIVSLFGAYWGVGYLPASDGVPDKAATGDNHPEKGTTNEKEEQKSIGVELDAAFIKDQSQLPGSQIKRQVMTRIRPEMEGVKTKKGNWKP